MITLSLATNGNQKELYEQLITRIEPLGTGCVIYCVSASLEVAESPGAVLRRIMCAPDNVNTMTVEHLASQVGRPTRWVTHCMMYEQEPPLHVAIDRETAEIIARHLDAVQTNGELHPLTIAINNHFYG